MKFNTTTTIRKTVTMAVFVIATAVMAFHPQHHAIAADAAKGKRVFNKCKACHVADQQKHKVGPHLNNLIGRKAGTVDGFKKYSKAMKESGIVWDEASLDPYLENPRKVVKGGTMAFAGLKKPADRANVIAYLKQFSK